MRRVAALVAIALLLVVGPLTGAAAAAPVPEPATGAGLRLDLDDVSPHVVTAAGPDALTVVGTVTNTGDRPVDRLVVRVQRGGALTTEGAVRDALDGNGATDTVTPQFVPLADALAPGASVPLRLVVPLRGPTQSTLALSGTGVHELLVNVNGVPRDGARARLAAARMLLPVLSLPADPAGPGPVPAPAADAVPFALLYPVTDGPRRLSTMPGETPVLVDDGLVAAFAPDGRLGALVAAAAERAPAGSRLRASLCLAVDPDLVQTAALMRAPYLVRGPDGALVPGTGAAAATRWLDELAAVARGGCVVALPYADADLVALTRGGLGDLAAEAVADGSAVLADVLGTAVAPGVTWPAGGLVDAPTLERTAAAGGRALLLSADGVEQGTGGRSGPARSGGVVPLAGTPQVAVLTDPLLAAAASGPAAPVRVRAAAGGAAPASTLADSGGPLATQDALGALLFRSQDAGADRGGAPLVLAPPRVWDTDGAGARALLDGVDRMIGAGLLSPRSLDDVVGAGAPAGSDAVPVAYPIDASAGEVPGTVVDDVRATALAVTDLRSAAVDGSGVGITPDEAFAPLRQGLVRPASAAWRGRPDEAAAAAAAGAGRIEELRAAVRVLEPPAPYSLGAASAPILVTVANGLPVTVRVRVEIASSPGLRLAPIDVQQVPPLGRRQVQVSAEAARSGQFSVQAAVRSPDGGLLGPPSRLRVRSTAYGTITVWLTASAGVLLVVLVGRRIVRRIRGTATGRPATAAPPDLLPTPGAPDPLPADGPGPHHPEPPPDPRAPALPQDRLSPDRPSHRTPAADAPAPPADPRPVPAESRAPSREDDPTLGDPFPDPLAATDRLPPVRPRPDGPPRVPSP